MNLHIKIASWMLVLLSPIVALAQEGESEETEGFNFFPGRVRGNGISLHYNFTEFPNYLNTLGPEAIEALKWSNVITSTSNVSVWQNWNVQSYSGMGYWAQRNDSVRYRSANLYYSLIVGRNLVNNNWLLLSPQVGIQGYGHFLRSSAEQRIVPLNTFVNQPNLQMLMMQFQAIFNMQMAIKLPVPTNEKRQQVWVSAKGGYFVPLNATPIIYSGRNRVTSDQPFTSNNLQIEVGLIFIKGKRELPFKIPDSLQIPQRDNSSKI